MKSWIFTVIIFCFILMNNHLNYTSNRANGLASEEKIISFESNPILVKSENCYGKNFFFLSFQVLPLTTPQIEHRFSFTVDTLTPPLHRASALALERNLATAWLDAVMYSQR